MNKKIKVLLSVMIVSLSALFILFQANGINAGETVIVKRTLYNNQNQQHSEPVLCVDITYIKNDHDIALEKMNAAIEDIDSIEDKEEWFIAYKAIISEYENVIDPPETIYDYFTDDELELLFRVVQAEVGDEYSFNQKVNVANVIFNRVEHKRFPNTLLEVLIPGQFSTISNGRYKKVEVSEKTITACEYAFMMEDTTEGCLFFDSNNTLKYKYVFNDGAHNFYTLKEESSSVGNLILLNE